MSDERNAIIEECAKVVEPKREKPCDCIKQCEDSKFWHHACDCMNFGDSDEAQNWCTEMNNAQSVRSLKS